MTVIKEFNVGTSEWETILVGKPGAPGAGVASGGATGQVLAKASNTNFDTTWVNPQSLSPFAFANDQWVGAPVPSVNSGIMQENGVLSGTPVFLPGGTITDIGIEVTGAGSSGSLIHLCVYALSKLDGTLIWDAGSIDGTSATSQSIGSGTATISAGWYFLGAVLQGNPGTRPNVRRNSGAAPFTAAASNSLGGSSAFPSAPGLTRFGTTVPLPTSVTFFTDASRAFVASRVLVKGTWT